MWKYIVVLVYTVVGHRHVDRVVLLSVHCTLLFLSFHPYPILSIFPPSSPPFASAARTSYTAQTLFLRYLVQRHDWINTIKQSISPTISTSYRCCCDALLPVLSTFKAGRPRPRLHATRTHAHAHIHAHAHTHAHTHAHAHTRTRAHTRPRARIRGLCV